MTKTLETLLDLTDEIRKDRIDSMPAGDNRNKFLDDISMIRRNILFVVANISSPNIGKHITNIQFQIDQLLKNTK